MPLTNIYLGSTTTVLTGSGSHLSATGPITGIYQSGSANVTLTPGTWRITGYVGASMGSAGTTNFVQLTGGFFSADGANSGSTPTALSGSPSGNTIGNPTTTQTPTNGTAAAITQQTIGPFLYTVAVNTTIYCVPAVGVSGGTVTATSSIYAEKI